MTQLECDILNIINETIEGKYIGKLAAYKEDNTYCLDLYLDHTIAPAICLIKDCKSDDEFKEFVRQEIKSRKLEKVSYWKVNIDYDANEDLVEKEKQKWLIL